MLMRGWHNSTRYCFKTEWIAFSSSDVMRGLKVKIVVILNTKVREGRAKWNLRKLML